MIKTNVLRARPGAALTVLLGAVDYESGEAEVELGVSERPEDSSVRAAANSIFTPRLTLSGVLEESGIDGNFVLLCDIEGSEAGLILEDERALARCSQALFELHPAMHRGRALSVEDLTSLLVRLGFVVIAQRGPVLLASRV